MLVAAYVLFEKHSVEIISREKMPISILQYDEIIELPSISENEMGFTCTGMSYDCKRDSFWMGNFGKWNQSEKDKTPSIVQISRDFKTVLSQIPIPDSNADLQGISYDEITDTLWYSNGKHIINCTVEGVTIKKIDLTKYRPNGVLFDSQTNSLWVLCFYNYLLHYDADGNLIRKYKSNYVGQDHLCFNKDGQLCFSAGTDYNGDNNYVVVYSMDTMRIEKAYQVIGSYAIEGISIIDSTLYIANDGYYHDADIKKNYVAIYYL